MEEDERVLVYSINEQVDVWKQKFFLKRFNKFLKKTCNFKFEFENICKKSHKTFFLNISWKKNYIKPLNQGKSSKRPKLRIKKVGSFRKGNLW